MTEFSFEWCWSCLELGNESEHKSQVCFFTRKQLLEAALVLVVHYGSGCSDNNY